MSTSSYINTNLKDRPTYHTVLNSKVGWKIEGKVPEMYSLVDKKDAVGSVEENLSFYCMALGFDEEETHLIKENNVSFLFDESNEFINHSK